MNQCRSVKLYLSLTVLGDTFCLDKLNKKAQYDLLQLYQVPRAMHLSKDT